MRPALARSFARGRPRAFLPRTGQKGSQVFSDEIKIELAAPLDGAFVESRNKGGRDLSYMEGWRIIEEANRIFGHDGWSRETLRLDPGHAPYQKPKSSGSGSNWATAYVAIVRVTASGIVRDGTGFGSGIMGDLSDSIESAVKEAETDAMKRAMMTFGYPLGLALYDKTKSHVSNREAIGGYRTKASQRALFTRLGRELEAICSEVDLVTFLALNDRELQSINASWRVSWDEKVERHRAILKQMVST